MEVNLNLLSAVLETDPRRSWAARIEVLSDLEGHRYAGKQPGEPLDAADLRPDTAHFTGCYACEVGGVARVEYSDRQSERILAAQGLTPPGRWAEGSRLGIHRNLRGTPVGRAMARRLLGAQMMHSVAQGCSFWGATIRVCRQQGSTYELGGLFWLVRYLPWELGQPVSYPKEQGGPDVDEPIYPTRLDLRLIRPATWFLAQQHYQTMFPHHPPTDTEVASWERLRHSLEHISQINADIIRSDFADWLAGRLVLQPIS